MDIIKAFESAFQKKQKRDWKKIYVLIDIHDTVFEACYHNKEEYKWYKNSKEALQLMSGIDEICLILWTSTFHDDMQKYLDVFEENGIHFDMVNVNTETKNTSLSCFDEKTYFNVGIDDKFGFEPEQDWSTIYYYLHAKYVALKALDNIDV